MGWRREEGNRGSDCVRADEGVEGEEEGVEDLGV